jgi:hypothetical protein
MSDIDYIISLCFDLAEQGKTPSVGLIRSYSKQPLAIPTVIKGLQHWQSNPDSRPKPSHQLNKINGISKQTLEQRVTELEEKVALLISQLAN